MRTRLLLTTAVAALAATTLTALAPPAGADAPPPCDSTVVLHVGTGRGGFDQGGPEVTVFADGRVFFRSEPPGDDLTSMAITEEGIERILRKARKAGLFDKVDYGDADITDQGTTAFEVRDGKDRNAFTIYALFFRGAGYGPGDLGLTEEQHDARARVAKFADLAVAHDTYERYERTENARTIDHEFGTDDVVLHTSTTKNYWGGEYSKAAAFTLYGDGRLERKDGSARDVGEARVQTILCEADQAGLLRDTDYGEAMVTDQGTTTVEVHAGGVDRTLEIYALELVDGDRGLEAEQRQARKALRSFLHSV